MSVRKHLTYANVMATVAVVFAMGGSAVAASRYLITSTKQIKPSVLTALRGRTGATGATGATGSTGAPGATGKEGPAGLSALSNLPSGASESGVFAVGSELPKSSSYVEGAISFPVPLAATLPRANTIYNAPTETTSNCPGPGKAARGYLCLYSSEASGVSGADFFNPELGGAVKGSGRAGSAVDFITTTTTPYTVGTYTVTAP